jgi:hypothetical protein
VSAEGLRCCFPGCDAEGTHEAHLLLISPAASLRFRQVVSQQVKLTEADGKTPMKRCSNHQNDPDFDTFFLRTTFDEAWPALAAGFERVCKKKFNLSFPPEKGQTVIVFVAPDEKVIIDAYVRTPRGLEDLGKVSVSVVGDETRGRARARS